MRLYEREIGVSADFSKNPKSPKGPLIGPCDVGFMGLIEVQTAQVTAEFELIVVESKHVKVQIQNI